MATEPLSIFDHSPIHCNISHGSASLAEMQAYNHPKSDRITVYACAPQHRAHHSQWEATNELFSSITSVFHSTENTETPVSATFASRKDTVYAPISGMLVDQKEINDEVISQGLLGKGYGILPVGNVVYAPVSGRVDVVTVTNHAIGILSETGAKVLIHVGLDTVDMDGKGFTRYVEAGDIVSAGQPILSFDDEAIKAAGHDDVVTCVVSNPQELDEVHAIGSSSTLLGGRPLVKVGDPLIVTK